MEILIKCMFFYQMLVSPLMEMKMTNGDIGDI
jgi:hypothetical protein